MTFFQSLNQYTGLLALFGGLIVASTYVFVYMKQGGGKANSDAVVALEKLSNARKEELAEERRTHGEEMERMRSLHQAQVDALNKRLDEQEKQVETLRKEIKEQNDKYQSILVEKDKQISNITTVLQGRAPEIVAISEVAVKFMKEKGQQIDEMYQRFVGSYPSPSNGNQAPVTVNVTNPSQAIPPTIDTIQAKKINTETIETSKN